MRRYTIDDIMAAHPCDRYPRSRVEELWSGRDGLTAQEIAALDIPLADRLWAVIAVCLDDTARRVFACDCAERALYCERDAGREPDPRSISAIEVARRYAAGDATREEFGAACDAACDAAWAAARAAACDAAWAAAWAAARAAACDAASDAAWAAAWAAARAAERAAAWYAARDAAMASAWYAARAAERAWQLARAVELAS